MAWHGWLAVLAVAASAQGASAPDHDKVLADIDLSRPFATRSPWRLTVTEGAPVAGIGGDREPGIIRACLGDDGGRTCDPAPTTLLAMASPDDFATAHYLEAARVVHPLGQRGAPMLLIATASIHSGDGDQRRGLLMLSYDRASDRFRTAYRLRVNRNNNQEIRYVDRGPLAGTIVSAEPTQHAPFGYWIAVSRPGRDRSYHQALRYRSATRYGDGNALPVIDSEMPAIEGRLGLWRPGRPLPLPAAGCATPRMIRGELWCGPKT